MGRVEQLMKARRIRRAIEEPVGSMATAHMQLTNEGGGVYQRNSQMKYLAGVCSVQGGFVGYQIDPPVDMHHPANTPRTTR